MQGTLESERSAYEAVDTLFAITVQEFVLAVQPVIELEEKREVGLGLRTKYLFTISFRFQSGLFGLSYPHIVLQAEVQIHDRR